jgi:transcriptional regulator GlxA family with amidase domain
VPERSIKRPFKPAMGAALIDYVQNLRAEEAKRLLEAGEIAVDDVAAEVDYESPAVFLRLFMRCTCLTPGHYRRMFQPIRNAARIQGHAGAL